MENDNFFLQKPEIADHMLTKKDHDYALVKNQKTFPIVGIGGSAGSFQSLEKFFTHMPADSGMAFVIIVHLDPNHAGNLAELIQTFTPMPVVQITDGIEIKSNQVYIIPPNKDIGIHNRKLLLLPAGNAKGYQLPIDYFFQSLAEDQWNKAVAIVFSGMGSDGETGLRMIKEKLGMAMVQDPETAQFDNMPKAAIGTNLVDYVLAPEEMPIKLIQYLSHPAINDEPGEQIKANIRDTNDIHKILMILRGHTGHDFGHYKKSTITRRIDRRLAYHQLPDYLHYITYLRENPEEVDVLFNELLIGVTKFFRDSQTFDSLKEKLFPLLQYKGETEPIRVWIAGCSTGEEAYSVAILLVESFQNMNLRRFPKIQIFATDLDRAAIEFARSGIYNSNIIADVSPERLEQFFVKREDTYQVKKDLREIIVFAQHNLIKDAPFTRLDLISCRNVMIYMNVELQKRIIPIFHYSLNPGGILLLGPAETIGGYTDMFTAIDPKWKLFERKDGTSSSSKIIDFPFNISKQSIAIQPSESRKAYKKQALSESFNKFLLNHYTPVSLLINQSGEILYINGKTGKFLELDSGEANMNIFEIAKEELKNVLRNAVHQTLLQKTAVTFNDVKVKDDNKTRLVSINAKLIDDPEMQGLVLITLEDKQLVKRVSKKTKKDAYPENPNTKELEKELEYTKQQLQNTIQQMETSLEELKSTNEELQSTNEELQSTNEESLTTKEEMQSLNEELMTINTSYEIKTEELTKLNNDMKNLLDSTEIGTIFLDNQLTISRFTPNVKMLFNVIPTDIGRSVTDIVFNFDFPDFMETVSSVMDTLVPKEAEIKTKKGEWFNLRIMPYRTIDNFINGLVLTFTNITKLKLTINKLNTLIAYSQTVVNHITKPAVLLNSDKEIIAYNKTFTDFFKLKQQNIKGLHFSLLVHEFWKTTSLDEMIKQMQKENIALEFDCDFPVIGKKNLVFNSIPSVDQATGETLQILLVIEEKPQQI